MGDTVIQIDNLWKKYRLGILSTGTLVHDLNRWWHHLRGRPDPYLRIDDKASFAPGAGLNIECAPLRLSNDEVWALRDISLEVGRGEVVGIIGRNGAGKSTLLKILSRVTTPSHGCIRIRGRIASLLEVGTGFHPDLTGCENIYLNGAILGMSKAEVHKKLDEIVDFSGVEKYIDTPVKRYSSGMYVRLAFAVAAHLESEILIVDEVLAVGDAEFQKKCLGKMGEVGRAGRTVLYVSHNMGSVRRLCSRSVLLGQGAIEMTGPTEKVISRYESAHQKCNGEWLRPPQLTSNMEFEFTHVSVKNNQGRVHTLFTVDEAITIELAYTVFRSLSGCQVSCRILAQDGTVVFTTSSGDGTGVPTSAISAGKYWSAFTIPPHLLGPGNYHMYISARLPMMQVYDLIEDAVSFEISDVNSLKSLDGRLGLVEPLLHWENTKEQHPVLNALGPGEHCIQRIRDRRSRG